MNIYSLYEKFVFTEIYITEYGLFNHQNIDDRSLFKLVWYVNSLNNSKTNIFVRFREFYLETK